MQRDFLRYLSKRADLERWPLYVDRVDNVDTVIVIPCLAERANLGKTLASIAASGPDRLQRTLVICVVNNRSPDHARVEDIADNRALLDDLQVAMDSRESVALSIGISSSLRIAYVDASTPGNELPEKAGVGLARKIGLDWGVSVLGESDAKVRLLCCLDADTTVAPNYLDANQEAFAHAGAWAGVIHFEHPLPDDPAQRSAIVDYECFLRCHVHGLRKAGSPYAFHTVGSTIVCTPEAYVAVSGMNRRQAAEDFYFLQQLAKTGEVRSIASTTVHPSARPSHRVPFGTGRRMHDLLANSGDIVKVYNPCIYMQIQQGLTLADAEQSNAQRRLEALAKNVPLLHAFLREQQFESAWSRIHDQAQTKRQRIRQFHTWFDAFRALKLAHYLRDNGMPSVRIEEAARTWAGPEHETPESFLMWLREQDRAAASGAPMGLG